MDAAAEILGRSSGATLLFRYIHASPGGYTTLLKSPGISIISLTHPPLTHIQWVSNIHQALVVGIFLEQSFILTLPRCLFFLYLKTHGKSYLSCEASRMEPKRVFSLTFREGTDVKGGLSNTSPRVLCVPLVWGGHTALKRQRLGLRISAQGFTTHSITKP